MFPIPNKSQRVIILAFHPISEKAYAYAYTPENPSQKLKLLDAVKCLSLK